MSLIQTFGCCLLLISLAGCGKQSEPSVYTIPKEEPATPPSTNPMRAMAQQSLSSDALNSDSKNPSWIIPAQWVEVSASSMRKASFQVRSAGDQIDISVTSFPGDVGGLLANINRWRGQIGLNPTTQSELDELIKSVPTQNETALICEMTGPSQATFAAIVEYNGFSWFFKMTGPSDLVHSQKDAFNAFVHSIDFSSLSNH